MPSGQRYQHFCYFQMPSGQSNGLFNHLQMPSGHICHMTPTVFVLFKCPLVKYTSFSAFYKSPMVKETTLYVLSNYLLIQKTTFLLFVVLQLAS